MSQGSDFCEANTRFHAALQSEKRGQYNDYTIALREREASKFIQKEMGILNEVPTKYIEAIRP
jgi:hypothetical protein